MASRYGVPEESTLVDWPIGYDDLAPWYERAEWEIGVSGAAGNPHEGHRARGYPMPPLPSYGAARVLREGAHPSEAKRRDLSCGAGSQIACRA